MGEGGPAPGVIETRPGPRGTALPGAGRRYTVGLVPFFLLVPFFSRPTYRYTIVPDRIWGFEQKQVRRSMRRGTYVPSGMLSPP